MPQLRVLDGGRSTSERICLARYALVEHLMDAQTGIRDLDSKLATIYACVWSQKRTKALLALSDLQADLAAVRAAYRLLAGLAEAAEPEPPAVTERPAAPRRAPGRRRRDRMVPSAIGSGRQRASLSSLPRTVHTVERRPLTVAAASARRA